MALRLRGSTSGFVEIDAPAEAGDVTLTLPSTAGTINVKDASGNTEVGTGVTLGNPSADIFTINNIGGERLRIASDGTVTIPGDVSIGSSLNVAGVLTYEDVTSVDAIGLSTFRDGLNTKDVGMIEIDTTISDTAVDIFIYDTSKDSDGGEWRKKTSHTSWYNETLNTATRGSRREFPDVAVIVAESNQVTIYDGDDPDLPMWMVFNNAGTSLSNIAILGRTQDANTCVEMLNGVLFVGNANYFATRISFISENVIDFIGNFAGTIGPLRFNGNIAQRNTALGKSTTAGTPILDATVNDVAMTVLPNAPIDDATGLPVPTIAVATDGGVSVIKDDGNVYNYDRGGNAEFTGSVAFDESNDLIISWGTSSGGYRHITRITNLSSSTSSLDSTYGYVATDGGLGSAAAGGVAGVVKIDNIGRHFGIDYDSSAGGNTDDRLGFLHLNASDTSKSLVAFATTSYNTGWMHGDIKGAFLSDTDTTNVTGTELVTNGTFDSDVNGWTAVNATITYSSGTAVVDRTGGAGPSAYQAITTVVGEKYVVTGTVDSNGTGDRGDIKIYSDLASTLLVDAAGTDNQTVIVSATFTATTTTSYVYFSIDNTGTATFDNVSVRIAEEDRSVNNKGLQVFGTITKSAVATGADLVGYSGFSASNYLQQPYNSNLGIDSTDSLSIICWTKASNSDSGIEIIFGTGELSTGKGRYLYLSNGIPYLDTYGGASQQATQAIDDGNWHQLVGIYTPNGGFVYVDGRLVSTPVFTVGYIDQGSTTWFSRIGASLTNTDPYDNGSIALFRLSNSVPSPEQIKKMYEDEKVLFQENSQATLYGSSDAVTALAYDEVTDQLHVGTSSGRSDFQGLRRINNTTVGITTAISAHDSFIIEQ